MGIKFEYSFLVRYYGKGENLHFPLFHLHFLSLSGKHICPLAIHMKSRVYGGSLKDFPDKRRNNGFYFLKCRDNGAFTNYLAFRIQCVSFNAKL